MIFTPSKVSTWRKTAYLKSVVLLNGLALTFLQLRLRFEFTTNTLDTIQFFHLSNWSKSNFRFFCCTTVLPTSPELASSASISSFHQLVFCLVRRVCSRLCEILCLSFIFQPIISYGFRHPLNDYYRY